jgi:RNA polymerase sigma-70 factor, ECF subfamily
MRTSEEDAPSAPPDDNRLSKRVAGDGALGVDKEAGDDAQISLWRDEIVAAIPSLRRFAAVLVSRRPHDQEELVQDTILHGLGNLSTNPPVKNTRAWLMSIMHNLNVNNVRKAAFRNRVRSLLEFAADRVVTPTQHSNLELQELRSALVKLPSDQREVIMLVCVEGLKYQEVSTVLGIPIGTVMSRLARARESLRRMTDTVNE